MKEKKMELAHAREPAQKEIMRKCLEQGICPFCRDNLPKYHQAPVRTKGYSYWAVTENDFPYDGAENHILIVLRRHATSINQLLSVELEEMQKIFRDLCSSRNIKGASVLIRSGEMAYTGASVAHLHAHIISGGSSVEHQNPNQNRILAMVGYKKITPRPR